MTTVSAAGIPGVLVRSRAVPQWLIARLRNRAFWVVQAMVAVITPLHYLLEANGYWKPFEHTFVMLYLVPILYGTMRFGREGGIATSLWVGLLTAPDLFIWHRHDFIWLEDAVPTLALAVVAIVLSGRVEAEARQRRLAEAARAEVQALASRYRSLFESASDAVVVFDAAERIVLASPATVTLLGYTTAELRSLTATALLGPAAEPVLARVRAGEAIHPSDLDRMQFTVVRKDGGERIVDATWAIVRDEAGQVVAQTVLRDVTAQRQREESLRLYAAEVTRAQEKERQRLARELHDETAQLLVALCQGLDRLGTARRGLNRDGRSVVTDLTDLAKRALESIRRFARDLRPTLLDDLGLVPAIRWLVTDLGRRLRVDAQTVISGAPRRLPDDAEVTLFRAVQEALRNVERHAAATCVVVDITFAADAVRVTVTDDGKGFEPPPAVRQLASEGQLGLLGMQERVQLLGGTFQLTSRPGAGTRLQVALPTLPVQSSS